MSATRQLFLKHLAPTSPSPMGLEIVQGRGIYLTSAGGKRYMDLISGISVSNLGHHHPVVHKAILKHRSKMLRSDVSKESLKFPKIMLEHSHTETISLIANQ
jgi:4-aminobutyrate aminotransferase-like enzyme